MTVLKQPNQSVINAIKADYVSRHEDNIRRAALARLGNSPTDREIEDAVFWASQSKEGRAALAQRKREADPEKLTPDHHRSIGHARTLIFNLGGIESRAGLMEPISLADTEACIRAEIYNALADINVQAETVRYD